MINFSAPDYIWHHDLIMSFAQLQKDAPEIFYDNRKLESSYGLPGGFIWSGGRNIPTMYITDCYDRVKAQQEMGLHIKHVCTNSLLRTEHLKDVLCNNWLKEFEREGDSVIVNNAELKDYIEHAYPKYNIIYSTTKNITDPNAHNAIHAEGYDTVLYYCHNHNEEILSQIKHPEKVEIICAEACKEFCPVREKHYEEVSKVILGESIRKDQLWECPNLEENDCNFYINLQTKPHSSVTNDWVDYLYNNYGYNTFKIAGRDIPSYPLMERLLYYLIKPEYRDTIRLQLWHFLEYDNDKHYKM